MDWILSASKQDSFLSPQQPFFLSHPPPPPPPPPQQPTGLNLNNKVSPSILLIIIIIAIIFFISGLLHLLVRFILRKYQTRDHQDWDNINSTTPFQGQLQQLFHLHDSGVDQSYIDNLPIFSYKSIVGVKKDPFDCAVCLCEFEEEDDLRLLPMCSHAFHMECIDTWLLSNSTCPLCRASLLSDFDFSTNSSTLVLVLESGISESSREIGTDGGGNTHLGSCRRGELGSTRIDFSRKSCEIEEKGDGNQERNEGLKEKTVLVKLGNFRNLDGVDGEGISTNFSESSDKNVDSRRCFSMGSFAYVMDETSSLQVPIRKKLPSTKKTVDRAAVSECGNDSTRKGELFGTATIYDSSRSEIGVRDQKESFSISKIWLRGKNNKEKQPGPTSTESGRRVFSFRFPVHRSVAAAEAAKSSEIGGGTTISEADFGSELGYDDEESQRWNSSLTNEPKTPSFARRTLLWLGGKQNKVVVQSSFSSNI